MDFFVSEPLVEGKIALRQPQRFPLSRTKVCAELSLCNSHSVSSVFFFQPSAFFLRFMFVNARSRFVAPADCPWSGSWTIKLIEVKSVLMNSVKVTSKKCASWISRDSEVDQHFDSSSLIADTLYREISWRFLKYQCGIGFWTGEIARVNSCFFHFFFLFLLGCCYWRCTFNSGPPLLARWNTIRCQGTIAR